MKSCSEILSVLSAVAFSVASCSSAKKNAVEIPPQVAPLACEPAEELAALDYRQPVPLAPMMAWHQKQNMMQHLVAIQRITAGLAEEDWSEISSASALIESSDEMQQMCEHMGAGADGFAALALDFHSRADAIGSAARAQDGAAVLWATAHTLKACTGCHAGYRQEVVAAARGAQPQRGPN